MTTLVLFKNRYLKDSPPKRFPIKIDWTFLHPFWDAGDGTQDLVQGKQKLYH